MGETSNEQIVPIDCSALPVELFAKTDKQLVSTLPRYLFDGPIHVIVGEAEAARAVDVLRRAPLIGIDTETRPVFRKGDRHAVALLQAATDEMCFLFRLCRMGLPDSLVSLLEDKAVPKVGLSLRDDAHMLHERRSFTPGAWLDLQNYVKEMGIADMSLQKLFANVFRRRISKHAQLSNWEADTLTPAQQRYAATDAVACIALYRRLTALRSNGYTVLPAAEPEQAPLPKHPVQRTAQTTHRRTYNKKRNEDHRTTSR